MVGPLWNAVAASTRTRSYADIVQRTTDIAAILDGQNKSCENAEIALERAELALFLIHRDAETHGLDTTLFATFGWPKTVDDPSGSDWEAVPPALWENESLSPQKITYYLWAGGLIARLDSGGRSRFASFRGSQTWGDALKRAQREHAKATAQDVFAHKQRDRSLLLQSILRAVIREYNALNFVFDWEELADMPFSPRAYAIVEDGLELYHNADSNYYTSRDPLIKDVAAMDAHKSITTLRKDLKEVGLYLGEAPGNKGELLQAMIERWARYVEMHHDAYTAFQESSGKP